jgi:hypothetical protein
VRILICTVLTVVTLLAAPAAMAERDDGPEPAPGWLMALDFVVVRPSCLLLSAVWTGVFVATLPITYPFGGATGPSSLSTHFVTAPWRFTTSRYYGNFYEYRDHRTIRGTLIPDQG